MASCGEDFTFTGDEHNHHHHHHQHRSPHSSHHPLDLHRFALKSHPSPPPSPNHQSHSLETPSNPAANEDDGEDNYRNSDPQPFHPFSTEEDQDQDPDPDRDPFTGDEEEPDPKRSNSRSDKRKEQQPHEELSDGGTPFYYKKPKPAGGTTGVGVSICEDGEYRVEFRPDYRKDREEWSDSAIGSLLDAYTDKYVQLNRGNLRNRDWEEVATVVSGRCDKQKGSKSVEQCKNKVDNLKKRFKVERNRMQNHGIEVSHWPWFKKIEEIVSNSPVAKSVSDEDKSGSGSANALRPSKRYTIPIPSPVGLTNTLKLKALANPRWRRVVFKISGASLAGSGPQNIDPKVVLLIAKEVSIACRLGVEVAIVIGGRNFFCGDSWVAATGLDRSTGYQIGMMATVMNSILLQSALEKLGVQTRVQSAFPMQENTEPYNKRRAIRHLEKGRVVIFGGVGAGTGNPLFTTDTASALRASELNADAVLKGTNVDGIYDCHSRNDSSVAFEHLSFRELLSRGITTMDMMALTFCEENGIPVVVFNMLVLGNISRALCGQHVGTLIDQAGRSN